MNVYAAGVFIGICVYLLIGYQHSLRVRLYHRTAIFWKVYQTRESKYDAELLLL